MVDETVIFIDPGTTQSAWVEWDVNRGLDGCIEIGLQGNATVLFYLIEAAYGDALLVLEEIQSYGMPVGKTVFDTVFWSGRFAQAHRGSFELMPRRRVKLQLCGSSRAKDSNIRQAVIDRMGPIPTKKRPNPRWPAKPRKDIWAAAAMALAWMEEREERQAGYKRIGELALTFGGE